VRNLHQALPVTQKNHYDSIHVVVHMIGYTQNSYPSLRSVHIMEIQTAINTSMFTMYLKQWQNLSLRQPNMLTGLRQFWGYANQGGGEGGKWWGGGEGVGGGLI